jgi:hypothetical protein
MNLGAMNRFTPLPQQALQGQSVKQQRQGTLPKNAAKILLDVAFEHGKDVTPALTYHWKSLIAEGATQKELEDLWVKIPTLEEAKTRLNELLDRRSSTLPPLKQQQHLEYRASLSLVHQDVVPLGTPVVPNTELPSLAGFSPSYLQEVMNESERANKVSFTLLKKQIDRTATPLQTRILEETKAVYDEYDLAPKQPQTPPPTIPIAKTPNTASSSTNKSSLHPQDPNHYYLDIYAS